jgi:hypothetical protein
MPRPEAMARQALRRFKFLFWLNFVGSVGISLVSIFLSATFHLYQPHPVGHLVPATSIAVSLLWIVLCALLARQSGNRWRTLVLPGLLTLSALLVFALHYQAEVSSGRVYVP